MPAAVYNMVMILCRLVSPLPIGTNLGLLHLLWMLVSGRLLESRGAVIPGLSELGLTRGAIGRAWAALSKGERSSERLLREWSGVVEEQGQWEPHSYGGYCPVAVDIAGFFRPRLQRCPTTHYHGAAGKALTAIPIGLIGRIGSVGSSRLVLPLGFVRADQHKTHSAHLRTLIRQAAQRLRAQDVPVVDRELAIALLGEAGVERFVVRLRKDFTARRAAVPEYKGRGRPRTRGEVVRPLDRRYKHRLIPATTPDRIHSWEEEGAMIRAEEWTDLVSPAAEASGPTFTVWAIHDPGYRGPLLLATSLTSPARLVRDIYSDRWPIEQLPLNAKQMLGVSRSFVYCAESRQRLPELALLAGSVLSYVAATQPAIPTGYWDRNPKPTPGRLRRLLARTPFPRDFPFQDRIRQKASLTDHLPKGYWGQRRPSHPQSLPHVA